ncbi:GNAT family N-acetyltransferase [Denitrobaculum tricleocarpae]|uniref:GNAT family N-acetyltransferase n=1 Tax=Denitrobaculum tricleocarpae TaxID=2591009 RepID=A0A545TT76_9PROT|nr:GNAT family N-acetyltransferase [Denitrobaculum tricleocarpae]TQV80427.1 GNAT family N-acetyltransferase [Denitrobaculum tricleocarpae]
MIIRPYQKRDAVALAEIFLRAVEQIGSRHYTPDQVAVWAARCPTPEGLEEIMRDGRARFVAIDDARGPVAFSDLKPDGHIHFLYCAPEAAGKGITTALFSALEEYARLQGMTRLTSEASEAARRFFLKQGFVVMERRDFELSGVAIHNYAVEKVLSNETSG